MLSALAAAVMLLQLAPLPFAGDCLPGTTLCGSPGLHPVGRVAPGLDIPRNGLFAGAVALWGNMASWPSCTRSRSSCCRCSMAPGGSRCSTPVVGPIAAGLLTDDPNEMPAIWCLFSIGITLIALSPPLWRVFSPAAVRG